MMVLVRFTLFTGHEGP